MAFAGGELFVRLVKPVPMPLRGNRIVLPRNKHFVLRTPGGKLDEEITWTMNSLGFRGPPPPAPFDDHLTLIAVGGSTTECRLLSDGKDWPAKLLTKIRPTFGAAWVNNAGFDGHSTFGHAVLLQEALRDLGPDYVMYLVGVNDVGRDELSGYDATILPDAQSLRNQVVEASDLLSTAQVLYRSLRAFDLGLRHIWSLDLTTTETGTTGATRPTPGT